MPTTRLVCAALKSDRLGEQRDEGDPARAGRSDEQHPDAEGHEGVSVLGEHPGDRAARHTLPVVVSGRDVANEQHTEQRRRRGHEPDDVGGADAPVRDDEGADERADEDADPVDAAERGQRAGAQVDRYHVGQVRLAGQPEDARRDAEQAEGGAEDDEVRGEGAADHAERLDAAGHHQGVPLADPRGQRARGQVGDQLPDPDEGEQERGDTDLGPERPRGEHDDRQDGPRADRAERGRTVGRERDAAQAPDRLDHVVTLRRRVRENGGGVRCAGNPLRDAASRLTVQGHEKGGGQIVHSYRTREVTAR